jgi:N-acetylneuraminate synthase
MAHFDLGGYPVGPDSPPFVIAEAGVHHGNSVKLAKDYIRSARRAGAHAIKFQTYKASRLTTRWAPAYWDVEPGKTQHDIFAERDKLGEHDYREMFAYAAEVGIVLMSTPFDDESAVMLDRMGMPAFKIASADLTNWPLVRAVAEFGKPMILSTGASRLAEVRQVVDRLSPYGMPLALLHCTLAYPTPLVAANLLRITELRRAFGDFVIGYSDHTQPQDSELACPLSVALGARIVEKHFTLDPLLPDDDHYHAVDPEGLARLVKGCADAWRMTAEYAELTEVEEAARERARRSIVAARKIEKGDVLGVDDIDFKRPGTGVSPMKVDEVLGRTARRAFELDELIRVEDLD